MFDWIIRLFRGRRPWGAGAVGSGASYPGKPEVELHDAISTKQNKRTPTSLPIGQVLVGDCLQLLETIPDKSIDLIFADPPYNLQLSQELFRPNMTRVDGVVEPWDRFDSFTDYDAFTRLWLGACRRVLKDTGTLWVIGSYHNIYRVGGIMHDLGYWILNDIAWIKSNPTPNFRGVRFTNAHETLIWAQKKRGARYTFNHQAMKSLNDDLQMRSDWVLPLCVGKERIRTNGAKAHATQKPEALLYRVVLSSTNPGDVVLDPFFGSGTTGAVAKALGRHWIGIEQEADYIRIAEERLKAVQPALPDGLVYKEPRRQPRLPFGALLEAGMLHPGQVLYFGKKESAQATLLADGTLRCGTITGSIHMVARQLTGAPSNGWDLWYYEDEQTGQKAPIDHLRELIRARFEPGPE